LSEGYKAWTDNNVGRKLGNAWDDYTGVTSEEKALEAAEIQAQAGRDAMAQEKAIYEQNRADNMPWMQSGQRALGEMDQGMGSGRFSMGPEEFDSSQYQMPGEFSFTMDDFQDTPYYQFLQDEGAKNVNRSAAAGGRLGGGDVLNALQNRGQMTAMNEFGNQFNRAMGTHQQQLGQAQQDRNFGYQDFLGSYNRRAGEKANDYNRLAGQSGTGQMQAQYLGGLGEGYGARTSDMMTQIANAQASGLIGGANARMSGLEELASHGKEAGKMAMSRGFGGGGATTRRNPSQQIPMMGSNKQSPQWGQSPYQNSWRNA
jgi:hypothetical protein